MTKVFCDLCNKELNEHNNAKYATFNNFNMLAGVELKVKAAIKANAKGDFCRECVMEAIKEIFAS